MKLDDRQLAVAQLYARSILEVAREREMEESLLEELEELRRLLDESPGLRAFIENPTIEEERRRESLERLLRGKASDLLVDSLQVINRKGRLPFLEGIIEAYGKELRELQGLVDATVVSAVELDETTLERLASLASRISGRRARLLPRVDPGILGGLVMQIGDERLDASVASGLRRLTRSLMARASEEILSRRSYVEEG